MADDPKRKQQLPNYHQFPQGFLRRVAQTLAEGEQEYGEWNFIERCPSRRFMCDVYNHAFNHLAAFAAGDTSEDHLAHAVVNLLFLMAYQDKGWLPADELQQGFYDAPSPVEEMPIVVPEPESPRIETYTRTDTGIQPLRSVSAVETPKQHAYTRDFLNNVVAIANRTAKESKEPQQ